MNRLVTLVKNDTGPDLTVVIVKNDDNQRFVTSPGNVYLNIRRKDTTTNIVTIQADSLKSLGTQAQYTFHNPATSPVRSWCVVIQNNFLDIDGNGLVGTKFTS